MDRVMELVDQHGTADLDLVGKDGNAFNILGLVGRALRQAGWPDAAVKEVRAEMMAGDYDHLLCVAMLVTEPNRAPRGPGMTWQQGVPSWRCKVCGQANYRHDEKTGACPAPYTRADNEDEDEDEDEDDGYDVGWNTAGE